MNKRIALSLSIIGLVAALTIGGTLAYFNDTETSTGNILTAGSIDLKVDHKFSSYDGKECTRECKENLGENLIKNGSFEVPEVTDSAKWQIYPSGSAGLEWTVEWAGTQTTYQSRTRPEPALIEYHENILGPAQDGDQYTELDSDWFGPHDPLNNEPALVKIHQDIATTPGAKYNLHYYYAPRPSIAGSENIMYVNVNGVTVATHSPGSSGSSIVWKEYTYEFTADSATTKIEFEGGGANNSLGIFLDDVSLRPYDCTYQQVGGTCTLWDEKDLVDGDIFWNFADVKPGDYGFNIISLHVYSNDAYACMIANNIVDLENDNIKPEQIAGDVSIPQGELSQFIKLFIWEDSTQNNVYDVGETILAPANTLLSTSMNKLALAAASTKYIGMAWCAGTQSLTGNVISCDGSGMGNIAQTDSLTADVTAYAVQQRNNGDFNCADVQLPIPVKEY